MADPFANDPWLAEKQRRTWRRPSYLIVLGLYCTLSAGVLVMLVLWIREAVEVARAFGSDVRSVPGDSLESSTLDWLNDRQLIQADERILYFSSDPMPEGDEIPDWFGLSFITDRRAVSCSRSDSGPLEVEQTTYAEIVSIKSVIAGSEGVDRLCRDSEFWIQTVDMSHFCLTAGTNRGRDREFEAILFENWRAARALVIDGMRADGSLRLERQIETLARFDIELPNDVSIADLIAARPRAKYERPPFELLLKLLGEFPRAGLAGRNEKDDVLVVESGDLKAPGDYARIVDQLRELADGDLPLEDISDEFDLVGCRATVHFALAGVAHTFDIEVDDYALKRSIVSPFAQRLTQSSSSRRFVGAEMDEYSKLVIVCVRADQIAELRWQTGIDFEYLD